MLTHFYEITGIKHHMTIPYSKEEHGIMERANKEVNRHIRNILFDKNIIPNWSKMLCMTEITQLFRQTPTWCLTQYPTFRDRFPGHTPSFQ